MKIVLASKNKGKIQEFEKLLQDIDIEVVSIDYEDVEETGETFEENSLLKAQSVKQLTEYAVVSDDTGLCIDEFNGWPGVHSARVFPECENFSCKCDKVLEKMKNAKTRDAHFATVITLILENGKVHQFRGEAYGKIAPEKKGISKIGYDAIFYSNDLDKTFAEATTEEKNNVSHRGRAFKQLKEFLANIKGK